MKAQELVVETQYTCGSIPLRYVGQEGVWFKFKDEDVGGMLLIQEHELGAIKTNLGV